MSSPPLSCTPFPSLLFVGPLITSPPSFLHPLHINTVPLQQFSHSFIPCTPSCPTFLSHSFQSFNLSLLSIFLSLYPNNYCFPCILAMAVQLSTKFSLAEDSLGLPCIPAMALQSSVGFSYSIDLQSLLHPYLGNGIGFVPNTL
jgi:hypothetical protein